MEILVIMACLLACIGIGYSIGREVGFQRGRQAAMREMEAHQRGAQR